jgi:hypothetical protein
VKKKGKGAEKKKGAGCEKSKEGDGRTGGRNYKVGRGG